MAINGMKIRNSIGLTPIAQPTVNVVAGDFYFDSTANQIVYWNGTSWLNLSSLTGTETLTNKTLTAPSISAATITGLTTLTDATTIVNASTASKVLAFNLAGMTTARTLTLSSSQSTTQTLTIPNITASDTLATLGLAQTFSAATTFSASGTALTINNNATISSSLGIGTAPSTNQAIRIASTTLTSSGPIAAYALPTFPSTATAQGSGFCSALSTAASSFTCALLTDFYSTNGTIGSSSTVTRHVGFYTDGVSNATNNAVLADNATFTGNWFLNQSGSAISLLNTLQLTNALGVSYGGTGDSSFTAYAPIIGGTTSTGALQSASSGMSNSGYVFTSNGSSAAPTWQASTGVTYRAGKTAISNGTTSVSVTFSSALSNTSYAITCNFVNTTDTNPVFEPITITAQSTTGFTATWNAPAPTANYSLFWAALNNN